MNLEFELLKKYSKKPFVTIYENKIKELLNQEKVYILINRSKDVLVTPIKNTEWVVVQVFESEEIANLYIQDNKLEGYMEVDILSINSFLLLLEKLFYKGVTGILYNCKMDIARTIYIQTTSLFIDIEDTLVKNENQNVIKVLLNALYTKEFLNYIYNPMLNADEISIGIVKYAIRSDGKRKCIDLFENRDIAEKYCKRKGIEKRLEDSLKKLVKDKDNNETVLSEIGDDFKKEKYPVTTVMNEVLFHSLRMLLNKEENDDMYVRLHTKDTFYKIDIKTFIQLVINAGFKQLDLS